MRKIGSLADGSFQTGNQSNGFRHLPTKVRRKKSTALLKSAKRILKPPLEHCTNNGRLRWKKTDQVTDSNKKIRFYSAGGLKVNCWVKQPKIPTHEQNGMEPSYYKINLKLLITEGCGCRLRTIGNRWTLAIVYATGATKSSGSQ